VGFSSFCPDFFRIFHGPLKGRVRPLIPHSIKRGTAHAAPHCIREIYTPGMGLLVTGDFSKEIQLPCFLSHIDGGIVISRSGFREQRK
jgi:hypothetical protein